MLRLNPLRFQSASKFRVLSFASDVNPLRLQLAPKIRALPLKPGLNSLRLKCCRKFSSESTTLNHEVIISNDEANKKVISTTLKVTALGALTSGAVLGLSFFPSLGLITTATLKTTLDSLWWGSVGGYMCSIIPNKRNMTDKQITKRLHVSSVTTSILVAPIMLLEPSVFGIFLSTSCISTAIMYKFSHKIIPQSIVKSDKSIDYVDYTFCGMMAGGLAMDILGEYIPTLEYLIDPAIMLFGGGMLLRCLSAMIELQLFNQNIKTTRGVSLASANLTACIVSICGFLYVVVYFTYPRKKDNNENDEHDENKNKKNNTRIVPVDFSS